MFGLIPDIIRNIKEAVSKISQIEKVVLYGSRAKGNYKDGSDIDIILFGKNLNLKTVYALETILEELYLPYTFDISIFTQIDNDDLIEHILSVGKVFYTKNSVQLLKYWEEKKLKEIGIVQTGTTPKTSEKENFGNFIPFIKPADVNFSGSGDIRYDNDGLSKIGLKNGRKMGCGSILMVCIGATIGKVGFAEMDLSCNQQINSLTVKKEFDPKFICYAMTSVNFQDKVLLEGKGSQATLPIINKSKWENLTISYPKSLPEQKRIVAILDKAFAAIAKAKANAEQNLKNAKGLFESYLQEVFENKGEGWEEKSLKQVSIEFGRGKSKHRPRGDISLLGGNYPLIQTGDVSKAEHLITTYSQTYNEKGLAQSKLWVKGTICIAIVGANVAETAILGFDACFPDSVIGIVVNPKLANQDYVEYLLQSFKSVLKEKGKGTARDNINMGTFETQTFPFPNVRIQQTIVKKLDTLSSETKKLEAIYQQKIEELEELKKTILQKAFNGELTEKEITL